MDNYVPDTRALNEAAEAARWREASVGALRLALAAGDIHAVRATLMSKLFQGNLHRPEFATVADEARLWLRTATAHERIHGPGSAANKEHPFYATLAAARATIRSFSGSRAA